MNMIKFNKLDFNIYISILSIVLFFYMIFTAQIDVVYSNVVTNILVFVCLVSLFLKKIDNYFFVQIRSNSSSLFKLKIVEILFKETLMYFMFLLLVISLPLIVKGSDIILLQPLIMNTISLYVLVFTFIVFSVSKVSKVTMLIILYSFFLVDTSIMVLSPLVMELKYISINVYNFFELPKLIYILFLISLIILSSKRIEKNA